MADADLIALGDALLDLRAGTLSRAGALLPLRAKSFRLLCELARQRGRVVPKEELLDRVWEGVHVTEDSLTQAVRDIRRALGDDGTLLRTIARRGFLLVPSEPPPAPASPPASRPRIAVLPLLDRTGRPDAAPLLDGLVEEITSGLARFRALTVVARHSAFAAAAEGLDLPALAARLGVDLVVDGTARAQGDGLRLAFALNDARTGELLWSDAFEADGAASLTLQDLVPRSIVQRLFASVEEAGHQGALRRPTESLSAFEHLARGRALFRSYEPGVNERAADHFRAAIEADPCFGMAHALLAMAELALHDYDLAPPEVKQAAKARAALAAELAPDDSGCARALCYAQALFGEWEAAERSARRAVELNPCDPDALAYLARVLLLRDRAPEALDALARAKALNPLWPPWYDLYESSALFDLGRYAESARSLRRLPRLSARQEMRLAATCALGGDEEGARRHAARARALEPGWDFAAKAREGWSVESPETLDRLVRGIDLAKGLLDA